MFEHLSNCHGEWNVLFAMLGSAPVFGLWFRTKVYDIKQLPDCDAHDEKR